MGEDADRPPGTAGGTTADTTAGNRYVETFGGAGDSGAVTLVGVVHDHPASVSRVRRVVETTDPDALALELPPLAVPLYEAHAAGGERQRADSDEDHHGSQYHESLSGPNRQPVEPRREPV